MGALGASLVEPGPERRERGRALLVVGRVHVDEQRLRAGLGDPRLDLLDVGESRPEVEMDPRDPVAGAGQGQRGRLAHARRCAEDQRPALAVVCHGRPPGRWWGGSGGAESSAQAGARPGIGALLHGPRRQTTPASRSRAISPGS